MPRKEQQNTENVRRAQERKWRNRVKRQQQLEAEATETRSTVAQIRQAKFAEVQRIIRNPPRPGWLYWERRGY
jgi:hypothetical protein